METKIERITPEMAINMLSKNSSNRKLRIDRVSFYAKQMKEGKWHLTGQTIVFGKNDELLDGQHRLWAIVESDTTQEFLVVYNADKVNAYDCGLKRSISDQLYLSGSKLPNCVLSNPGIAVIKNCITFEMIGDIKNKIQKISADDVEKWVQNNYDDAVYFTDLVYSQSGMTTLRGCRRAVIFATLWAIYKLNVGLEKPEIERIVEILRTGMAKVDEDAPIVGFRNQLISESRMNDVEVFHRLQYAVHRYLHGSTTTLNRYEARTKYDFTKLIKEEN